MHFYSCPYCWDKTTGQKDIHLGRLIVIKSAEIACHHKGGLFTSAEDQCKKENYKCKEVLMCPICDAYFKISEEFLKEQKKKDKDG
tara:strand:- start:434 stop:691 length:258 start_codon:yes stop_codon:yes gene_type:complete